MNDFYALILAGGKGTRLWPLSRPEQPKALLSLTGKRTFFQQTLTYIDGLIEPDHIFVVAHADLCEKLHAQESGIPCENFVHEPSAKDSGPALLLGLLRIAQHDPAAVVIVLSIDSAISDITRLQCVLTSAYSIAHENWIVTLGVTPSAPSTQFGYIRRGEPLPGSNAAYYVDAFIEKPDLATATAFLKSGNYLWDSGMMVLNAQQVIAEFERQQPDLAAALRGDCWEAITPISLDYAIMQQAQRVAVLELNVDWNDIGSWKTWFALQDKDCHGNAVDDHHILVETQNTFIFSKRPVIAIGVQDLIVVETDEGLLLCKQDQIEKLRSAVNQLKVNTQ